MGRPSRTGERADQGIFLRVTHAELEAIRRWAAGQRLTVADACRLTVLDVIASEAEGFDIATRPARDDSPDRAG